MKVKLLDRFDGEISTLDSLFPTWVEYENLVLTLLEKGSYPNSAGADVIIGSIVIVSEEDPFLLEGEIQDIPYRDFVEVPGVGDPDMFWTLTYQSEEVQRKPGRRPLGVAIGIFLAMGIHAFDIAHLN